MQEPQPDVAPGRRPWRHGGVLAGLAVLVVAAAGVGIADVAAGDGPAAVAPAPSPSPSGPAASAVPPSASGGTARPTPSVVPGPTGGPPQIVRATAADLQWTRASGFLTCSGLVINVRATTTGEVTKVVAHLLRVSGGATTTVRLSGSQGRWSASSLELNAPSEWRVRVVATGPGGIDEQLAEITAPDGSGTTLRHVCEG
ncbi:MAG: hypothetical protein U0S36_01360 [Candidatus Nanopelagicales bacterium]